MTSKELKAHKGAVWFNAAIENPGHVEDFSPKDGRFVAIEDGEAKLDCGVYWYVPLRYLYPSKGALAKAYRQHLKAKLRNLAEAKRKYLDDVAKRRKDIEQNLAVTRFHLKHKG